MRWIKWSFPLLILWVCAGCAYQQDFVKGEDIRSRSRRVAVLPLVNLTPYPHAGQIVGDLIATELYALSEFRIMERTEMVAIMKGSLDDLDEVLERAVAHKIGLQLGVDSVIFGSVTEYRYKRGLNEDPVVGINVRLLDVPSGEILWAGSQSGTGGCFWFCEDSLNRLAQKSCHALVTAMIKAK